MSTPTKTETLSRNNYGALVLNTVKFAEQLEQVRALLEIAISKGLIPRPFTSSTKKEFECLNVDIYDVLISRRRVKALVIQVRSFWRHMRKGHTRMEKRYCLIVRTGKKLAVTELDSATCVKRAKNTTALGQLVGHYLGTKPVACKKPDQGICSGYKVLAQDADGGLRSVYDGSEYAAGKWRSQAARPDHGGGYYFYWNQDQATQAVAASETFKNTWTAGKTLVLCEVEVAGRTVDYSGGKVAASRLRVMQVLQRLTHGSEPSV